MGGSLVDRERTVNRYCHALLRFRAERGQGLTATSPARALPLTPPAVSPVVVRGEVVDAC